MAEGGSSGIYFLSALVSLLDIDTMRDAHWILMEPARVSDIRDCGILTTFLTRSDRLASLSCSRTPPPSRCVQAVAGIDYWPSRKHTHLGPVAITNKSRRTHEKVCVFGHRGGI